MHALRFRLARWVMRHRKLSMLGFVLITIGFGMGLPGVQLKTIFSDLLPKDDPFVQVYKDHPNFGNPLTMTVMIQRKDGDIGVWTALRVRVRPFRGSTTISTTPFFAARWSSACATVRTGP